MLSFYFILINNFCLWWTIRPEHTKCFQKNKSPCMLNSDFLRYFSRKQYFFSPQKFSLEYLLTFQYMFYSLPWWKYILHFDPNLFLSFEFLAVFYTNTIHIVCIWQVSKEWAYLGIAVLIICISFKWTLH